MTRSGRPKNPESINSVLSASVKQERRRLVNKLADEQETTLSAVINSALDIYFESLKKTMTTPSCPELAYCLHLSNGEIIPVYSVKKNEGEIASDDFILKLNSIETLIDLRDYQPIEGFDDSSSFCAWVNKSHIVKITIPSKAEVEYDEYLRKASLT